MQDFIKINKDDNVAVALKPIAKGTTLNVAGIDVTTVEDIPQGHKFVIKAIKKGDPVIKYGFRIGFAQADIPVGAWVHTHNLKTGLGELLEYTYEPEGHKDVEPTEPAYFDGYMRENGKVGVRNEVWIVPTVGCVNSIARAIEATARANKPEGVDEVVAFTHPYGCSQTTEDQENTRKILADLINHPNAGAVLVLGLGCENSRIEVLKDYIGEVNPDRVKFLQVQDVENEQEEAEKLMNELMAYAATFKREKVNAKELIIGMKDGGITTLEDKSLGCTQKSGSSLVKGVLAYAEPVNTKGLNLLSAPGNDLVAATALAASGAHIVLFTTGRGTPFACPVPTMKISSNSRLAGKKDNWIDFNAGRIVTDDLPLEDAAKELFQLVLDVASGKKVKAEIAGFHDLAIFKQGVTL